MSQPNSPPRSRVPKWVYPLSRTVAWVAILGGVCWIGVLLSILILLSVAGPTVDEGNPFGAVAMVAALSSPCAVVAVVFGVAADRLARRYLRP